MKSTKCPNQNLKLLIYFYAYKAREHAGLVGDSLKKTAADICNRGYCEKRRKTRLVFAVVECDLE